MDKFDFIRRMINLYPHAIKDYDAQYDTYKRALPVSDKVDYEEIYNLYCKEYKDSFPPSPGQINEWASKCIKNDYQNQEKWLHVKIYNPFYKKVVSTDCFPKGSTEQGILNYYKKSFGGEGWRIVEIY